MQKLFVGAHEVVDKSLSLMVEHAKREKSPGRNLLLRVLRKVINHGVVVEKLFSIVGCCNK